ncbi:CpsD/CapB family tyrosine-protein kinase [Patulibacter defluvii]|uniref:CpsD/CapB family tyrosine-protein kinase n=1 Tax=Patulibacter defluvii TaxID=3095358 RepID=UPI002A74C0F5|nr:CpsD/CapB family tyrosine-protein kinase [Patulibacter sp. DM4]
MPPFAIVLLLVVPLALIGGGAGVLVDDGSWWPGAAGAAVGAAIGALAAVLVLRRRRRVRDGAQAQRLTGLPLVAHVPPPGSGDDDRRRQEEAFRMLRAALQLASPDAPGGPTVAVTSSAPGEGKTTIAAGLARALARAGRPVVAVEADLRRPGLAAALGRTADAAPRGLTAALVGGVPVADLLVEVEPGLRLLPAGELPPNAPELLGSPDGARVLAELGELDATVVLDTAPLLPVADTRELLAHGAVARAILVARPGRVQRAELGEAAALLPDGLGAVLAVAGRASTPRSYDRYLRDTTG